MTETLIKLIGTIRINIRYYVEVIKIKSEYYLRKVFNKIPQ